MEENWLWYLSGAMDTSLRMVVNISKDDEYKLGYSITPRVSFNRPVDVESIFGMVDEYVEEVGSNYHLNEMENSTKLVVRGKEDVERFLEPLVGGFIQQRNRAEFYLNEILPLFEGDSPESKAEFLEIVRKVNELENYPISSYKSKYDVEYFEEEWGDDLE